MTPADPIEASGGGPSLSEAAAELLAGRTEVAVVAAMTPQQPTRLIAAVLREARERSIRVTLWVADLTGHFDFLDEAGRDELRSGRLVVGMLAGGAPRELAPLVKSLPASLWETDRMLARGEIACDLFLARVAPAAGGAGIDLGNMLAYTPTLLARAGVGERGVRVGLELAAPGHPAPGQFVVPPDSPALAEAVVWRDRTPPSEYPAAAVAPDAVRDAIATQLASIVPGEATVELGIGALAEAIARALRPTPHLGFHTGILPTAIREALEAGCFDAGAADGGSGLHVATGYAADAGSAAWPISVRLRPVSETHAPDTLARCRQLWALNSGFSIDLTGAVNAEWVGEQKLVCGGGQLDFARAAALGAGASVIALPSRTGRGIPRVVRRLRIPGPPTTGGEHVDVVVTEQGVADLRGLDPDERAAAIRSIAHPDDRKGLGPA